MWVGGSITYLHCEMSTQHVLSGLCPCPCLLGSLCHLLAPTVLPSSLPAPVCLSSGLLSAFWSLLCLMHIELELSRNLYPPGDTGVQMCCVNLQLLCASIRDLRVVIYMVSRAPPRGLAWDFACYHTCPWPFSLLGPTLLLADWFS